MNPESLGGRASVRAAVLAFLVAVAAADSAFAQGREGEACKSEPIAKEKSPDFATAWTAAEKRAKAWAADAAVARLTHTTLGPIDADGRSANWYFVWYSPAANANVSITIANGTISCWGMKGPAGRMPKLDAGFTKDIKLLLATAAEKGGAALMKDGFQPRVEMSAGAQAEAYWYVNYEHPQKRGALTVIFDANSGKFLKALK